MREEGSTRSHGIRRFGIFELDPAQAVLRKNGRPVRIQDQPLRFLAVLTERPGTLVTREELRAELWADGEYVDFDRGLNTAVNRLRRALGDSAENPRFIETVPRRGYRFLAPLEGVVEPERAPEVPSPPEGERATHGKRTKALAIMALGVTAILSVSLLLRDRLSHASPTDRVMLAVLPFVDVSPDPEPYLGDGLTEELIGRLGGFSPERLGVIARTSVMTYKGTTETVERIGEELDVDFVLEGSVLRDGDAVRVMVRLIEVEDQAQLWTQSYQLDLGEIHGAQTDVAQSLGTFLTGESRAETSASTPSPVDPRAYDAYLKGVYFRDMLTEDGFRNGIELFEESISYEPEFAPAYAGMAACYCLLSGHGLEVEEPATLMSKARSMANHALSLDADLPIAHGALGMAKLKYEWDWDGAEAEFLHALELNPQEPAVHIWYAYLLSSQGRNDEALEHVETARSLDRFSRVANLNVAWQYYEARRYERALAEFDATLELHPGSWIGYWGRGLVHSGLGNHDAAKRDLDRAVERSGQHPSALGGSGYVLARAGEHALAEGVLRELTRRSETEYVPPSVPASICAALGDLDRAFEWLEKAYALRSRSLVWLAVAHEFDPLRSDPRYEDLLRRMQLEG